MREEMMLTYECEFAQARLFSKSLGLSPQQWVSFPDRSYFADRELVAFAARAWLEDFPPEQFALCPIRVCLALRSTVAALLCCNVEFTIGHVIDDGHALFSFNENDVRNWIISRDPRKIKVHAWLTLDSYEIVDLTMDYAKRLVFAGDHEFRDFTFAKPLDMPRRIYHPVAVDSHVIQLIGAVHRAINPWAEEP